MQAATNDPNQTTNKATQSWREALNGEKEKPYFVKIMDFLQRERAAGKTIYPPKPQIFNALKLTEFGEVKVVILGQDPYHGPGQAHGLCFSVQPGIQPPPSLQNMYKELSSDIGFQIPQHGCLQHWARQGVLLLNTSLTVEARRAQSHSKIGWQLFTDRVIEVLNAKRSGLVFLLWGSHAIKKAQIVDRERHCVLTAPHPSPLSAHRGFFGCRHFSKTNAYLQRIGREPIDWQLPMNVSAAA